MTARKFKNALRLTLLLASLPFAATAQAAMVTYYVFLYTSTGGQAGAGTFSIDDSQLTSDGLKPILSLQVNLTTGTPQLFNTQCAGANWQSHVDTATVTKVRHLANSPVSSSCRGGATVTLTDVPESGDTTGRYFQYKVTGTGAHANETGKYVIKNINTVPEPGSSALLFVGVVAMGLATWATKRRSWQARG